MSQSEDVIVLGSQGAKLSSSSDIDDALPRVVNGGEASTSTSDDVTDAMDQRGDTAVDVALAKLPLAVSARLVSAARSSPRSSHRELIEEWAETTKLEVALVQQIFASFAPKARASADAARDSVARIAAEDDTLLSAEEEYAPGAADVEMDDGDGMGVSSSVPPQPPLEEGVPYPGITQDLSVAVVCGDINGVLELKRGYKKLQERVKLPSGESVTPSKFESDAGRGSAKKWRLSLRVLLPNGKRGETVGEWIDRHGAHPKGLVIGGEKDEKATMKESKAPTRSAFEIQLDALLDAQGEIEIRSTAKFVRLMRETTKSQERALLLQVIRGTKSKTVLRTLGQSEEVQGLNVLQDWMEDAKRKFQSTLLVSVLRTLKMIPVSLDSLTRTTIGAKLSKLKSYAVPVGEKEHGNTEMNTKVVLLSKSVKNTWKEQITAPHAYAKPQPQAVPVAKHDAMPVAPTASASKAVELKDYDLFGGAKKTAPTKTTVVKMVTKITTERKVAAQSVAVNTKKPSVSVNDLLKKSTKVTVPVTKEPPKEPAKDDRKEDESGKKRKRKSVTWAPDDKLEQVRVFEKDAKRPKEVAFPDPVRDGDGTDAESRRALEMRDKEVEAERKAAAKQHQRRMDEMRATVSWRPPRRIPPTAEAITPGSESEEFERMLRVEAEKPSVKYKNSKAIPDSPAEAPNEDDELDLDNTPAFFMEFQEEELPQQVSSEMRSPVPAPPPNPMVGGPLPANIDFAALSSLIASVQQGAGAPPAPFVPPAAPYRHQPPPPPTHYAPQQPYQPGLVQPPQVLAKQATVGGAPVPVQNAFNHNGKTYRGVCAFFNTPRGCSWGDKCGYLHEVGVTPPPQ